MSVWQKTLCDMYLSNKSEPSSSFLITLVSGHFHRTVRCWIGGERPHAEEILILPQSKSYQRGIVWKTFLEYNTEVTLGHFRNGQVLLFECLRNSGKRRLGPHRFVHLVFVNTMSQKILKGMYLILAQTFIKKLTRFSGSKLKRQGHCDLTFLYSFWGTQNRVLHLDPSPTGSDLCKPLPGGNKTAVPGIRPSLLVFTVPTCSSIRTRREEDWP